MALGGHQEILSLDYAHWTVNIIRPRRLHGQLDGKDRKTFASALKSCNYDPHVYCGRYSSGIMELPRTADLTEMNLDLCRHTESSDMVR